MNWQKFRLGFWAVFWGAIGGAIVLSVIGFKWGGWVTHSTAEAMADEAVVNRLADICVNQFNHDPQRDQKLKEMNNLGSWERHSYVEKQGWATMPGTTEPNSEVADKCAAKLSEMS